MRLVAQLPPSLRDVVVLRVIYDYTHAEIAAHLGITATASEVRHCRAVRRLRELSAARSPLRRSA